MTVALLDVNLLIALAWPNHVHHDTALGWFKRNQVGGWATCPVTQSGFVRVSSNARVMPEARSPAEALLLLRRITGLPGHRFWADDISLPVTQLIDPSKLQGYRQVTDAHLLALALRYRGRLATLDDGIPGLVPSGYDPANTVCVLTQDPS